MASPTPDAVEGITAVVVAVIPIALGGVTTYFKIFITPKDDFRNRTTLKRIGMREKVASRLTALLQHVRSLASDDVLRGDGREDADLVAEYIDETFRAFTIYSRLSILDSILKYAYTLLYVTIVGGLAGALLAWLVPPTRASVLWASIGIIAVQVITVLCVLLASLKLDEYEDVT